MPEGAAELISQRRRWLNGSFAASIYSLVHFFRIYKSDHNIIRLFFFHIQAIFNIFVLLFSWFALANMWLTFSIIISFLPTQLLKDQNDTVLIILHWINLALQWVYIFFVVLQFVLALGNRPKGEKTTYRISFVIFAILGLYATLVAVALTVKAFAAADAKSGNFFERFFASQETSVLLAALAATFGIYMIASLLYADPWHSASQARPRRVCMC